MLIFVDVFTNFIPIMTKKFSLVAVAILTSLASWAEGYQINTLSAKQLGMGHTGTALKLGAESMIFNPAGLGFSEKTLDISASVTAIKADATCTIDGADYRTDNGVSTPLAVNASFRIIDNLQAGISFYTPYGSAINWTNNWPGSMLSQQVSLKVYTVQPTVSWRILPNLSVGAGLMIAWGGVNLDKALISGQSFETAIGVPLGHTAAASINLQGDSKVAVGVNVGAMFDINKKWTLGASFRSKMGMNVSAGTAALTFANEAIAAALENQLGVINQSQFASEMPCPYVFNFGASFRPNIRWTIAADIQLTGWKTYKELNIEFPEPLQGFNQNIPKDYRNALCYHVGAQFAATGRLDVRAGLMIDTTPVNSKHYNPETPGMTKVEPTIGLSFRPINNLSIDIAFMYVHGCGAKDASCSYDDLLLKSQGLPEAYYHKIFTADYRAHAFAPALGVSYSF